MAAQGIPCISGILPPSSNYKGLPSSNVRKIAFSSMQSASPAPNSVTKTIYDRRKPSPNELRMSLFLALASQSVNNSQRIVGDLVMETIKYVSPKRLEARNLEELLVAVPDLETVPYKVVKREKDYEVREVQSYYVAETTMPGDTGFDFYGSSQSFNALAAYLFGKNKQKEEMAMTTPVIVQKSKNDGEKLEMTTPVLTRKAPERGKWVMSFVMPSKYGAELPLPVDPSVRIKRMPEKLVAVSVFSGFVSNEEVRHRESKLRASINTDTQIRVKEDALVEVAQYNPPFTPPFMRRNEISLEVEWNQDSTSF